MKRTLLLLFALLACAGSLRAQSSTVTMIPDPTIPPGQSKSVYPWNPLTEATGRQILAASGGGTGGSSATPATNSNEPAPVSVTTASATALAANASRKNAVLVNTGTTTCFLSIGGTAVAGRGIPVLPNQPYSIDSTNLDLRAITAITASGTTTLAIHEGY